MKEARAYCPAAVSFIFRAYLPERISDINGKIIKKLINSGSTGIGCTVDKKVYVRINRSPKKSIFFNGKKINLPTIDKAMGFINTHPVKIEISSQLPLASGFGISGAATLATLYCINELLSLKHKRQELHGFAHAAEILAKTGLGTVATQITGGFLIKNKPGLPVSCRRLKLTGKILYAAIISGIKTDSILNDGKKIKRINREAERTLDEISKMADPSMEEIIETSFAFCKKSNMLLPETERLIEAIRNRGGKATMAMIGNVVLSTIKPHKFPGKVEQLTITEEKAGLI